MQLLYNGTFEPSIINTDILAMGNPNITGTQIVNSDLLVTYNGIPTTDELKQIQLIINRHNPTPDATEVLKNLTKSTMLSMALSAETSRQIGWIVGQFNAQLESIRSNYTDETSSELLALSYTAWRTIYDGLNSAIVADIILFTSFFDASGNSLTEPLVVTDIYRAWFNRIIRDFLQYVFNRNVMAT